MKLTDEQQEVLHAWADGETTETENQVVAELTSNPATRRAAQAYITELKRVRELLATHGGVPAPEGLRERVLAALDRDEAPVIKLPFINWHTALVAAAAAVFVSLALVFSPPANEISAPEEIAVTEESHTPIPAEPHAHAGEAEKGHESNPGAAGRSSETRADAVENRRLQPEVVPMLDPGVSPAPVLRLNPGLDEPFEVSINLNRKRDVSILQVYNDILVVGSLHGDARILEAGSTLGEWTNGEEFTGHDFTAYDGVEVEIESTRVPELLSAVNRMNDDQGYGKLILPGYMRSEVGVLTDRMRALRNAVESMEEAGARGVGAQGYLPEEAQLNSARRLAEDRPHAKADARLARLLDEAPKDDVKVMAAGRKVRLLIRLR